MEQQDKFIKKEHMAEQSHFEEYKKETEQSIQITKEKIKSELENREYIHYEDYPLGKLEKEIQSLIQQDLNNSKDINGQIILETPPSHISRDFSLSTFRIAKILGIEPAEMALKIAGIINENKPDLIQKVDTAGPFVNLILNKDKTYSCALSNINLLKDRYGESDINAKKIAMFDYSAPNIAKPIGVGHLRSTIIGQALSNIYEKTGYSIIRDNHLGDWGTQFGQLIYAYQHWGDEEKISQNPINELKNLYVKFNQNSKDDPKIENSAREIFSKLEQKNPELVALWKKFRDLSIKDFEKTYQRLGVKFDLNIGESYFTDQTKPIVEECLKKGLAKKDSDTETVVVDTLKNLPSFLLQKQDGSSLYLARDLATIKFRVENFHPNTIVYVVGSEQELNFKQLLEFSRKAGYLPPKTEAKHIKFGMVLLEGEKMSTRKGTLIELKDLLSQSVKKSKEIIIQKGTGLSQKEIDEVSEIIGVGAIIYNDLKQSKEKNISFDWNRMLNFEAGSAVYLQYTYVRIKSIINKLENVLRKSVEPIISIEKDIFKDESEYNLAKKLMLYPAIIIKAQKIDAPHLIIEYLEELSQTFNSFYNDVSIIKTTDNKLQKSRINLINATAQVLKEGLNLLNIRVPEKM